MVVLHGGLQQRTKSTLYLALLVGGSVAAALVGAGVLLLTSARHRAPVVVGVALAAVLLPSWLGGFVVAPVGVFSGPCWILSVP